MANLIDFGINVKAEIRSINKIKRMERISDFDIQDVSPNQVKILGYIRYNEINDCMSLIERMNEIIIGDGYEEKSLDYFLYEPGYYELYRVNSNNYGYENIIDFLDEYYELFINDSDNEIFLRLSPAEELFRGISIPEELEDINYLKKISYQYECGEFNEYSCFIYLYKNNFCQLNNDNFKLILEAADDRYLKSMISEGEYIVQYLINEYRNSDFTLDKMERILIECEEYLALKDLDFLFNYCNENNLDINKIAYKLDLDICVGSEMNKKKIRMIKDLAN